MNRHGLKIPVSHPGPQSKHPLPQFPNPARLSDVPAWVLEELVVTWGKPAATAAICPVEWNLPEFNQQKTLSISGSRLGTRLFPSPYPPSIQAVVPRGPALS